MADLIAAAICNGSNQQLTAAVQKFAKDINKPTAFEAYPLHLAVWRNSLSAVQQLLDAGARTDVVDGEAGWSPLHKALYQGSLAAAALLLANGSSLDLTDSKVPLQLMFTSCMLFWESRSGTVCRPHAPELSQRQHDSSHSSSSCRAQARLGFW
eukprot:GHUV01029207.1.p1 GENE.GHUV01029207.1~~GHUV01029207.1.p1  ORF type:complete len:154 (+),score=49.11 GHUV01029207.1:137-598(+)